MNILRKSSSIKLATLLVIMAVIFGSGGYWLQAQGKQTAYRTATTASATSNQASDKVTYVAESGMSVLDQLKRVAKIETKESSYGTLVESINGVTNGTDGKYWLFYVDGQMADKGADVYVTKGGETIEWKFSK